MCNNLAVKKDTCPLCGGNKKSGKTIFTVALGEGVLVVRDVPALVCGQCGENGIEDKTASRLETLAGDARKKHLQVEVAAFSSFRSGLKFKRASGMVFIKGGPGIFLKNLFFAVFIF